MSPYLVRLERQINAPQKVVYTAWLNPEALADFMRPGTGMTVRDITIDARSGGDFSLTMVAGETMIPIRGQYRKVEPFERLEFSWLSPRTADDSVVTLTFTAMDDQRTRLVLEHVGFSDGSVRDDHEGGWAAIVDRLVARLTGC